MEMQPIDPNKPLTCELTAQEWNSALALINEGPHRVVRPIIDKLMAQLRQQSQETLPTSEMVEHLP